MHACNWLVANRGNRDKAAVHGAVHGAVHVQVLRLVLPPTSAAAKELLGRAKKVASRKAWEPRPVIFVLRNYGLDSATQSEEGTKAHFRMFRTVEDAARAADVRGSMISRRAGMSRGKLTKKGFMVVHISDEYPSEPVYVFDNYVRYGTILPKVRKVKPRASDKREARPAKHQLTSSIGKP